ncbi:LLM class flavin-dependent oxidoreductase [Rhodococcus jostii]|uniref:LLM class flavin-dependent oxidoreductase n=1 Tax=Rhodococcus jostii TaxID=132919 RepID=A0ABU4CQN8_RHOJO|nr:LLM class flavin-dependent oxidoreductase [Rhodococcus jostii]MDV6285855.1 LLM class flavin-dependent oxidoreductase [Rhodococcus jostii]
MVSAARGDDERLDASSCGVSIGSGESGQSSVDSGHRDASLEYLTASPRLVDQLGFHAVAPTGGHCEDAWLVTAALISATDRLTFLVAFRPGAVLPVLSAQMVSTFGQLSGGRVLLNVVGGDNDEQCGYGDNLSKYERCARARESFGSPGRWATASR